MAVLIANKALNMRPGLDMGKWSGVVTEADASHIMIEGRKDAGVLVGIFQGFNGAVIDGTVTGYDAARVNASGEVLTYTVRGFSINIHTLQAYNDGEDFLERDQFLFRLDDRITGSDFSDKLTGWDGEDRLLGGLRNDSLFGGEGDDLLRGQNGNDKLTGEAGNDKFRFDIKLNAKTNVDTITDFAVASDTILLDNAVFKKLKVAAELNANNFKASASGNAADATDHVLYDSDSGALYYDADGSGSGKKILFAMVGVTTHPELTAADFAVM